MTYLQHQNLYLMEGSLRNSFINIYLFWILSINPPNLQPLKINGNHDFSELIKIGFNPLPPYYTLYISTPLLLPSFFLNSRIREREKITQKLVISGEIKHVFLRGKEAKFQALWENSQHSRIVRAGSERVNQLISYL